VIGSGKRKATPECPIPPGKVRQNTHLLVTSLEACTSSDSTQGTLDAVISLALLLVELISPDVMYNGLPWPEEEFCKVKHFISRKGRSLGEKNSTLINRN
jgi:integrator complex subunit 5